MTNSPISRAVAAALLATSLSAVAAVSADEAAKLKTELTPLGGEKAGNKDGSIPAWTGGLTGAPAAAGRRTDPFKDDKPLFSVSAKNMEQHAAVLTDGVKALLKKYPDSFRIDVYPTHRTAAAPQWVYDNTLKNATRAKLVNDVAEGAYGGIPFPIPKNGAEAITNHVLRWRGTSWQWQATQYQLTADGKAVLTTDGAASQQMPYYFQDGSPEEFAKKPEHWMIRLVNMGPPIRAGESIVGRENIDGGKSQAWVYLTGQRRVRKLPNPCCDTPAPATAGVMNFDEIETFVGRIDRFDWKLVGKQEMLIPYNTNKLLQPKDDAEVLKPHHLNPDFWRWELHRVWVIEATLRQGQRHQAARSRYYCDEDSWTCVLGDRWDANGQLWRTLWTNVIAAPDLPGVVATSFGMNDLLSGQAFVANLFNSKNTQYALKSRFADSQFSPEAMAGEGVR